MGFGSEVAKALVVMREEKRYYKDYLPQEAIEIGEKLVIATEGLWDDVLESVISMLKEEIPTKSPYAAVWWYSVLLQMKKEPEIFFEVVSYIRNNQEAFSENTQFFLYYQLKSMLFCFEKLDDERTKMVLWKFYQDIVRNFANKIKTSCDEIPIEKRNPDLAIVITEQFLNTLHGPTKTALDRCKAIMTVLGKRVILINTVEVLSGSGNIPFCGVRLGNYYPELKMVAEQEWKGVRIPYFQCDNPMPDIEVLDQLLRDIQEMAPSLVISIGGSSILSNLVNRMIPVLTVGLGPADLEFTTTRYQTLSRKVTEQDRKMLQQLGYTEQHVIESVFTSSLKPQTEHVTRKEVGIPENKFAMIVVGFRLDDEVSDEFLRMLEEILTEDMCMVYVGKFRLFEKRMEKYPKLKRVSLYLGECQDVLSRMELCDLYLNPRRKGGGTSSVEALFKGVPVVSQNYGDVSVNVGEEFCVKDYEEMQGKILRYYKDNKYYQEMSHKAIKRAERLLDTDKEFINIINEVYKREEERLMRCEEE